MTSEERVVVKVVPEKLFHSGEKVYVNRVGQLGLTAYADSDEEAWETFKQMFGALVRSLRKEGKLEALLNSSGLEWWPESEYEGTLTIDGCDKEENPARKTLQEDESKNSWEPTKELVVVEERELAVAA